jgi:hypothetical protein
LNCVIGSSLQPATFCVNTTAYLSLSFIRPESAAISRLVVPDPSKFPEGRLGPYSEGPTTRPVAAVSIPAQNLNASANQN